MDMDCVVESECGSVASGPPDLHKHQHQDQDRNRKPPLVPPKPSKSKSHHNHASVHRLYPSISSHSGDLGESTKSNQSFETDDGSTSTSASMGPSTSNASDSSETMIAVDVDSGNSGSGDNLSIVILESLLERLEVKAEEQEAKEEERRRHPRHEISVDEFGDCSDDVSVPQPPPPAPIRREDREEVSVSQEIPIRTDDETTPLSPMPGNLESNNLQDIKTSTTTEKKSINDTNVSDPIVAINQSSSSGSHGSCIGTGTGVRPSVSCYGSGGSGDSGPTFSHVDMPVLTSQCPFLRLHYKNPCEFLPQALGGDPDLDEDKSRNRFLRIDDLSSKVDQRIKFIVENLKDCGGIWPSLFIEKLNKIIIRADAAKTEMCFQEDFSMIDKLVQLYKDERKCNVIFRYWCTIYNIMCRHLVPLHKLAGDTELINILKRDFLLASEGKCRCSLNSPSHDKDREHKSMTPKVRLDVISILLIPLVTSRAFSPPPTPENYNLNDEKSFIAQVLKIICNAHLDREECRHAGLSAIAEEGFAEMGTHIEVHLLLAMNSQYYQYPKNTNPLVQVCAELAKTLDVSLFRSKLLTIFLQEVGLLRQGHLDGIRSAFGVPLGLQILGVNGPMKAIIDFLSSSNFSLFESTVDLKLIASVASSVEDIVCESVIRDWRVEEIKINARELQNLAYEKLPVEVQNHEVDLDFQTKDHAAYKTFMAQRKNFSNFTNFSIFGSGCDSSTSDEERSQGSSNSKETLVSTPTKRSKSGKRPGNLNNLKRMKFRPFDLLMRLIGCKKPGNSVAPASISDISYLVLGSPRRD